MINDAVSRCCPEILLREPVSQRIIVRAACWGIVGDLSLGGPENLKRREVDNPVDVAAATEFYRVARRQRRSKKSLQGVRRVDIVGSGGMNHHIIPGRRIALVRLRHVPLQDLDS